MTSLIPSILALGAAAALALGLAWRRPSPAAATIDRQRAAAALWLAVGAQSVHFIEELATGFHARFPAQFGQPEMPLGVFVAFNVGCLTIWMISTNGVRAGRRPAFFAAWFLAVAGVMNLVAHPLMALAEGGYFPGVITAPLIGAAAVWLCLRLAAATQRSVVST